MILSIIFGLCIGYFWPFFVAAFDEYLVSPMTAIRYLPILFILFLCLADISNPSQYKSTLEPNFKLDPDIAMHNLGFILCAAVLGFILRDRLE